MNAPLSVPPPTLSRVTAPLAFGHGTEEGRNGFRELAGSSQKNRWPSPGKTNTCELGMRPDSSLLLRGSTTASASPYIMSVGALIRDCRVPPE